MRKLILAALSSLVVMVAMQAPASAAMTVTKPASVEAAAKMGVVKTHSRRKWRRWRHHRHHRHWRHHHHYKRWSWYKRCLRKQRHGYRIYCPYPY